ncbi:MAG: aldose 1-epimerase [Alphaproteobacteria bacterium]|nr:aldose 1-epimerase [Alphaproteobacteria bacterium]
MKEIILKNKDLQIGILPEIGASLSFLRYKEQDILRPTDKNIPDLDANNTSMFLMLPFCGRIRGGSFVYWGITRKMKKNQVGVADPIHGDGWKSTWEIVEQSDISATLKMSHDKENGFPFSYDAEVVYKLDETQLSVSLKITNNAILPMPCGMGIHPFFVKTKDMELEFPTKMVWTHESDPIFDRPYPTPEAWQFSKKKPLKTAVFDTCFSGFDGTAKLIYPENKYTVCMKSDQQFGHIVLYTPKGKNFVCLEPCTNASNAFNLAANGVIGTGIKSIGKDQSVCGHITLSIQE